MLGLTDLELAQQLQQEEYQQQQAVQPVQARAPSPQVSLPLCPALGRQGHWLCLMQKAYGFCTGPCKRSLINPSGAPFLSGPLDVFDLYRGYQITSC